MQEPRASVVSYPADGDVIARNTERYNVAARGVDVVVGSLPCAPHDIECMLEMRSGQFGSLMKRMLLTPCKWKGC